MAKCRMLLQENSELGRVISAGRTAKLEGEIALGKKFVEEMKQSQAGIKYFWHKYCICFFLSIYYGRESWYYCDLLQNCMCMLA